MPHFAWPWMALAVLLPLLAWMLPAAGDAGGPALRVPFFAAARRWAGGWRPGAPRRLPWLAMLAFLALLLAAMRPQQLDQRESIVSSGRDLMLAVDLSGSMRETDMLHGSSAETRLDAVKRIAGDFIERRAGDRIGLVLFGTRAYLQAPLTYDRATVRALLDEAVIGLAGEQTAIGDAIGLTVKRLREQSLEQRVLVLMTDGSNTAGELKPLSAARLAGALGLRIYTVGVGADPAAARLLPGSLQSVLRQRGSDLDERMLESIASVTGGRYFRARDQGELEQVYELLDELEPLDNEDRQGRPPEELYPWPLAAGLLLALLQVALARGAARTARRVGRGAPGEALP